MIINAHAHLMHDDMISELLKDTILDDIAKSFF